MRPFTLLPSFELFISPHSTYKLYILYAILIISTTFISFIISLSLFSSASEKTYPYFQLLENWNQPFLADIKFSSQEDCPVGYSRLFHYHWPGTTYGCYCRNAHWLPENRNGMRVILDSGRCTFNQTRAGCEDIRPIPAKELLRWRDFKVLCGKKMDGTSFIENFPKYPGDCPEDSLKCGGEDADSTFCIPNSFKTCPITSILSSKSNPGEEYNESLILDEGDNLKLYWTREPLKLPISEFRINEEAVCLNNHALNLAYGRSEYRLTLQSRSVCKEYDPRFQDFDLLSERHFFHYNQLSYLEDVLPEFRFNNNINWKLFTRSYIKFKLECRYMMRNLLNYRENVENIQNANEKWVSFICIFEILSLLLNIIYAVLCFKRATNTLVLQIITCLLNYIGRYCCLSFSWDVMKTSGAFKDLIKNMNVFDCSDDMTNSYFRMVRDDDVGFYIGFLNNMNIFVIFVDVIILLGAVCLVKMNKIGVKNQ